MIFGALFLAVALQGAPASILIEAKDRAGLQLALGDAAPPGSPEQRELFENAVADYRRAQTAATTVAAKAEVLEMLARLYDGRHLNEPAQVELVLRELAGVLPADLTVLFRLSRVQEEQQELDAAEETLLYARHAEPTEIEPNRMLVQFYARRTADALRASSQTGAPSATASVAAPVGEPDKNGFYHAGGSVPVPRRLDIPAYPKPAQDSGIEGTVTAEVSLNEAGVVIAARLLRSVPILDEAALDAVRNWHYEPAIVDRQAVPVKLTVTVSFSLRR